MKNERVLKDYQATEIAPGEMQIHKSWLKHSSEDYKVIKIKGDGYAPFFINNDILLIESKSSEVFSKGIYLVNLEGEFELRKVDSINEENPILKGISPYIPDIKSDFSLLIGRVVRLIREY